jgi:mevalonate kinase
MPTKPAAARVSPRSCQPGRAWGKVILLGEHAVVYGVPALAVGIDRGAHATATAIAGRASVLEVAGWDLVVTEGDSATEMGRAFTALVEASRAAGAAIVHRSAVRVAVKVDLPPGGGLGCSAALGVAIAGALVPVSSATETAELAMAWERVFHGNPSGIDAAVSAHGGSILFQKGRPMQHVALGRPLTVCVGSTGKASSTRAMVEWVAALRVRSPAMVDKAFDGIAALVGSARTALEAGDLDALGNLMDLNQMILSGLFLSTEELERLCSTARDAGALGAKLTGGGGGGSAVALAADEAAGERVLGAWQAAGFTGFVARVEAKPEVGG